MAIVSREAMTSPCMVGMPIGEDELETTVYPEGHSSPAFWKHAATLRPYPEQSIANAGLPLGPTNFLGSMPAHPTKPTTATVTKKCFMVHA